MPSSEVWRGNSTKPPTESGSSMNSISTRLQPPRRCVRSAANRALLGVALILSAAGTAAQTLRPDQPAGLSDPVYCDGFELAPGCGLLPPSETTDLVELEQLSPLVSPNGGVPSIQFRAGWPLIFRASVGTQDMLGIGRVFGEQGFERRGWAFAEVGQGASIVFDDPDGVWSYVIPSNLAHDERILDFYPDPGDVTGVVDDAPSGPLSHDAGLRFNLRPEFGGPLPQQAPDGTMVQSVVPDGVQFGADDDFPGLVILSNVGVGIVMSRLADGWTPLQPRQARNLAGLTTSVGYELTDVQGRTSITSMMVVPRFLFSHIRLQDPCVGSVTFNGAGEPIACAGPAVQRVDGGPVTPLASGGFNDESFVEIRAFVVLPTWNSVSNRLESLDIVVDRNGDGQLTAADAELMGHNVLSNEVVFTFRQIGSDVSSSQIGPYASISFCNGLARPRDLRQSGSDFQFDVDGNGYAVLQELVVCPGGGTGVTRPPQ